MIQRKQSLWLLIAALLNVAMFLIDVYRISWVTNGVTTTTAVRISDHYPSLLMCIAVTVMPLAAIFMFRNRKKQMRICALAAVFEASFLTMLLARCENLLRAQAGATGNYWIGAVLPALAIIFLVMAILGIRADEKLVRSADRLR